MKINCPNCDENFVVTVRPENGRRTRPSDSPITPRAMRSVLEFMREVGPGRHTNSDLLERYLAGREAAGWPVVTHLSLVFALGQNGATRWRTARERGWDIPEIPSEQEPAPVAPTTQERVLNRGTLGPIPGYDPVLDQAGLVKDWAPPKLSGLERVQQQLREQKEAELADLRAEVLKMHE